MTRAPRCPVCKKPLTQQEYERALGILEAKDKHAAHQLETIRAKLAASRKSAKKARQDGIDAERARTGRLLSGKEKEIQRLKERVQHLQRGTTPQTDGLEFEEKLAARLRSAYPDDEVLHRGKGGDVLHHVRLKGAVAGTIVYECKRTPRIASDHISQAERARRVRSADYAVLVTTGMRRGFTGLARERDVLIVAPLGVIALVGLLRSYLLQMQKAQVEREKRAEIARRILDYVNGADFKRPLEHILGTAKTLTSALQDEIRTHFRGWHRRQERYQMIAFDATLLRENTEAVLHGQEVRKEITPPKTKLLLPSGPG